MHCDPSVLRHTATDEQGKLCVSELGGRRWDRGFGGFDGFPLPPLRGPVWVPHASRFLGASESSESVYEGKLRAVVCLREKLPGLLPCSKNRSFLLQASRSA